MPLTTIVIIFLLLLATLYVVWKYVPEPPRTILLWIIEIALVAWVLNLLGFWTWIAGINV